MSLTKQFSKSKPVCKVTFVLSSDVVADAQTVALVGEFNNWDATANLLKKQKDGSFKVAVELEAGREFQFRYLLNNDTWINAEADKLISNEFGAENCVVVL